MRRNQFPFDGYEQGPDYDRARSQIATPFQYVDIALDSAVSNQIFNVSGDFLYVDAGSTGTVTLELNNQYNDPSAPFQVSAGFGLEALFKQLKLSWAAQAGKKVRLMYSTGDRVVPTNSTTISGGVSVTLNGTAYSSAFKSISTLASATPETIFTPAANVNGVVVVEAGYFGLCAGTIRGAVIAKTSAPASVTDGDVIGVVPLTSTWGASVWRLAQPIQIPSGKGLYRITDGAETGSMFWAVYRAL